MPPFPFTHTHTHASESAASSLVKSTTKLWASPRHYEYNERSLAPTQSAPGRPPYRPTPHTHNSHSRARGPAKQFHHTKTHTSPYPVKREKKNDRGGTRKMVTLGERWRKTRHTQKLERRVCVAGLKRERHTVGKLRLCVCVCPYHQSLINH